MDGVDIFKLKSYYDLKLGDAILKNGHVRLVSKVIGDTVYCIEQTAKGTYGTQTYAYSMSQLEDKNYIPISIFEQ